MDMRVGMMMRLPLFSHAIAGAAIAWAFAPSEGRRTVTALAAAAAVLPDIDVVGFKLGIASGSLFGHRGFTHSLAFAALTSLAFTAVALVRPKAAKMQVLRGLACLFAAAASHAILDALTSGGLGAAFLAPFDETRYSFPVRPIQAAPLDLSAIVGSRGLAALASEVVWIWVPAAVLVALAVAFGREDARMPSESGPARQRPVASQQNDSVRTRTRAEDAVAAGTGASAIHPRDR